jgi:hypothetical protein
MARRPVASQSWRVPADHQRPPRIPPTDVTRHGPFWDVIEGRAGPAASCGVLGWELVSVDHEAGTIEVTFSATDPFVNPLGVIQGGFLAAMGVIEHGFARHLADRAHLDAGLVPTPTRRRGGGQAGSTTSDASCTSFVVGVEEM